MTKNYLNLLSAVGNHSYIQVIQSKYGRKRFNIKFNKIQTRESLEKIFKTLLENNFKVENTKYDGSKLILEVIADKKELIISDYKNNEKYRNIINSIFSKDMSYLFC